MDKAYEAIQFSNQHLYINGDWEVRSLFRASSSIQMFGRHRPPVLVEAEVHGEHVFIEKMEKREDGSYVLYCTPLVIVEHSVMKVNGYQNTFILDAYDVVTII